jgi:2-polyprenyl-3-methyl-5-hydroxy-6-metoxy-1,4-benzoquinol methylase
MTLEHTFQAFRSSAEADDTQQSMPPSASLPDMMKMQAFMGRIMDDMSGTVVSMMCALGDRLGLFKDLAGEGPTTATELATRTGTNERYVREWLSVLSSAGYLEYDPTSKRFTLPPEHAMPLAGEGSPTFMGGAYQQLPALLGQFARIEHAFRKGGGVPQDAYDENLYEGMERISAVWFDHLLVQQWIPTVPHLQARLEHGARVADIGCGSGLALIRLAQAFPNSRFVGYDGYALAITRAHANAAAAGVVDRVRFEQLHVIDALPEQYDLVTTFDMLHDAANPHMLLHAIRRALKPGGIYLLLEANCSDKLEENVGTVAAILYSTSLLYCMPISLANGGEGLGTMGLPETKVQALCKEAGFSSVNRLPVYNPFNVLYEVKL